MNIIGVMAADPHGIVGNDGKLPWDYPDELEHFRKITFGQVLVMGYLTFKSVPVSFLKNVISIVLSHQQQNPFINSTFVSSLEEFLSLAKDRKYEKVFMIGGAEVAHLFLDNNLISEFILTIVHKSYPGDARLDLRRLETWPRTIMTETKDYTIYRYKNPKVDILTNQK